MWVGWNSLKTEDNLPKQCIGYMQNITLPPSRLDVVVETMRLSQQVAAECGDEYTFIHSDLAVAKLTLQILAQESHIYDKVFIYFVAFHIELAYFAILGHILEESGGPQILIDSGVLAGGSLNGFVSGRHYIRCKRLYPMLALAFSMFHFQMFLDKCEPLPEGFISSLQNLRTH